MSSRTLKKLLPLSMLCLALPAFVGGGLLPSAHADTYDWNVETGQWDIGGNWSQDGQPASNAPTIEDWVYINNGGTVEVGSGVVGQTVFLAVGVTNGNSGALNITAGGQVIADGGISLGNDSNSSGTVTVSGPGSKLSTTIFSASISVGFEGNGELTISDGGVVESGATVWLGGIAAGSSGKVTVSGADSKLIAKYSVQDHWINVGRSAGNSSALLAGTGKVIANNGGTAKNVTVYKGGTLSAGDAAGEIGTLNIGTTDANETTNLVLNNGATLRVDTSSSTNTADLIEVAGNVTVLSAPGEILNIDLGSLDAVADVAIINAVNGGLLTADHINPSNLNFTLNGAALSSMTRLTGGSATVAKNGNSLELTTTTYSNSQSYIRTWAGALVSGIKSRSEREMFVMKSERGITLVWT